MSTTRHPAIRIALFALAFRLVSAVLAFLENVVFPLNQPQTFTMLGQTSPFWDTFTRYDSGWYYQVARNGYQFVVGGPAVGLGKVGKIAYFPLYPLLMRWVGRLFGQSAADVYRVKRNALGRARLNAMASLSSSCRTRSPRLGQDQPGRPAIRLCAPIDGGLVLTRIRI